MIKKIGYGLVIVFFIFILMTLLSLLFGYQYYTVVSDSMYPSIPKNSLVYVKKTNVVDIHDLEGKVIAFES
ncbi:MAG: signal peptidase I, partial [Bacilli bacterium]